MLARVSSYQRGSPRLIAIVGDWAKVKDQLAGYNNITFLDLDGKTIPPPQ